MSGSFKAADWRPARPIVNGCCQHTEMRRNIGCRTWAECACAGHIVVRHVAATVTRQIEASQMGGNAMTAENTMTTVQQRA